MRHVAGGAGGVGRGARRGVGGRAPGADLGRAEELALPDSRFHSAFSSFIPHFPGSEACADRVGALESWIAAERVFITPDNSTECLRRHAMAEGKPFLTTTFGIGRGFLRLDPTAVPTSERRHAATLDGMDRCSTPVSLAEIARGPAVGCLVTGGSAVSANGVRFGKGDGCFDLEWALLSEVGAVQADAQVVDEHLSGAGHDVPVDWIVTPTRAIRVADPQRSPGRVRWELLEGSPLATSPPLRALRIRQGRAG